MQSRSKSRQNQKKEIGNRKAGSRVVVATKQPMFTHPPPYLAQAIRNIKLRFLATGAQANAAFTYAQLSSMLGLIAISATTSVLWTTVFRFKRVTIWGPIAAAGTPVAASVTLTETSNDFESPPISKSDTSVSFDFPAFVDLKPPKGSLASKWHGSAQTDVLLTMTFPSGSTVDLEFDFVLDDFGGNQPGPTIVGGTLGNMYHKIVNSLTAVTVNSI